MDVGFPFRALFQANEEGEETVAHEGEGGDAPRRGGFEAVSETMGPIQMDFSLIGDSTHTFLTRKKCVPGNKQAKKGQSLSEISCSGVNYINKIKS